MADYAAKADEFRKQAEKKLKSLLGGFFGNKHEDAAELFEKAANQYKLAKCWKESAEMYEKLAECQLKNDSGQHEAAGSYVEAAKAVAKTDPIKSRDFLQKAVDIYTDMGRLNMAARQLKEIAEQSEKGGQKEEAIQFYNQAADLFETEGTSSSEATKCKLKVAEFSAEMGKYSVAIEIFEEAARRAADNNLLMYSARGYLFQAGLCCLVYCKIKDLDAKLDKYRGIDLHFAGSREATLLEKLVDAMRELDDQSFANSLAEYDSVSRLDAWKVKILREAKRKIEDAELGVGDTGAAGGRGDDEEHEDDEDVL